MAEKPTDAVDEIKQDSDSVPFEDSKVVEVQSSADEITPDPLDGVPSDAWGGAATIEGTIDAKKVREIIVESDMVLPGGWSIQYQQGDTQLGWAGFVLVNPADNTAARQLVDCELAEAMRLFRAGEASLADGRTYFDVADEFALEPLHIKADNEVKQSDSEFEFDEDFEADAELERELGDDFDLESEQQDIQDGAEADNEVEGGIIERGDNPPFATRMFLDCGLKTWLNIEGTGNVEIANVEKVDVADLHFDARELPDADLAVLFDKVVTGTSDWYAEDEGVKAIVSDMCSAYTELKKMLDEGVLGEVYEKLSPTDLAASARKVADDKNIAVSDSFRIKWGTPIVVQKDNEVESEYHVSNQGKGAGRNRGNANSEVINEKGDTSSVKSDTASVQDTRNSLKRRYIDLAQAKGLDVKSDLTVSIGGLRSVRSGREKHAYTNRRDGRQGFGMPMVYGDKNRYGTIVVNLGYDALELVDKFQTGRFCLRLAPDATYDVEVAFSPQEVTDDMQPVGQSKDGKRIYVPVEMTGSEIKKSVIESWNMYRAELKEHEDASKDDQTTSKDSCAKQSGDVGLE